MSDNAHLREEAFNLCRQAHDARNAEWALERIRQWRQQSAMHEICWQQTQRLWQASGAVRRRDHDSLLNRTRYQVALWWEQRKENLSIASVVPIATATCIVLLVLFVPLLSQENASPVQPVVKMTTAPQQEWEYSSPARQRRTYTLADGSILSLNWHTRVSILYTSDRRLIRLHQGELYVEVAKDATRPFVVDTGKVQAKAVGTAFSVRREDAAAAIVTVSEGIVEVSAETARTTLQMNQQLSVSNGETGKPKTVEADQANAWISGMLVFEARPLQEVLNELGRYTSVRLNEIELPDPDSPVTATYFIDRADAALELIAEAFDLRLKSESSFDSIQ